MSESLRNRLRRIRKNHRMGATSTWEYFGQLYNELRIVGRCDRLNRYHCGVLDAGIEVSKMLDGLEERGHLKVRREDPVTVKTVQGRYVVELPDGAPNSVDASDLGLRPGQWPAIIQVNMRDGALYYRRLATMAFDGSEYHCRGHVMNVHND